MNNVAKLMGFMHQFTPKGQEIILTTLKDNKQLLKDNNFFEIINRLRDNGMWQPLKDEFLSKEKEGVVKYLRDTINKEIKANPLHSEAENLLKTLKEKSNNLKRGTSAFKVSRHFDKKLENVIKILLNNGHYLSALVVKNKVKSPEDINELIRVIDITSLYHTKKTFSLKYQILSLINKFALKFNIRSLRNDAGKYDTSIVAVQIQKALISPSKDKRVRNIESKIKKEFKVKFVHLDNYEDAQRTLAALRIAKKNKLPIPKEIIVSPFLRHGLGGKYLPRLQCILMNSVRDLQNLLNGVPEGDLKNILNLLRQKLNFQAGTTSYLHPFIHEMIHEEKHSHKNVLPEYYSVVEHLSKYAKDNLKRDKVGTEEIRTELRTKEILEGLNKEEKELLEYLMKR